MGRLAGRFDARPMSTPNLAPMIGVLLAVMTGVAFASTGERAELLSLEPPVFQACKCKAPFVIQVDARGRAFANAPGGLDAIIADLKRNRLTLGAVMIEAYPDASHVDVMRVYQAVRAAGEKRVQFTQTPDWALASSD